MSDKLYIYTWDERWVARAKELDLQYWKMFAFDQHWLVLQLSESEKPSDGIERLCNHLVNLNIMKPSDYQDWSTQKGLDSVVKRKRLLTSDEIRAFYSCIPWVYTGTFWRYFLYQDVRRFLPALKSCKECGASEDEWLGPLNDSGSFFPFKASDYEWNYQNLVINQNFCSIKCRDKHFATIAKERQKWQKGAETLKEIKTLLSQGRPEASKSQAAESLPEAISQTS